MGLLITSPKGALKIENMLRPYKRGEKEITLDVGMDVLLATNYARSIRDMLLCIEKLPIDKQREFESVVLLTFVDRLQPIDIHNIAQKLAQKGGYEQKLAKRIAQTARKHGDVLMSSPKPSYCLQSIDTDFVRFDTDTYDGLKVLRDKCFIKAIPNLPSFIDLTECATVEFYRQDLQNVKTLKLAPKCNIEMSHCYNLPNNIDFSQVQNICLNGCDLRNFDKLILGKGHEAQLIGVKNLPPFLDLSGYDKVLLVGADLSHLRYLKLKKALPEYLKKLIPDTCQVEIISLNDTVNLSLLQKIKQRFK